jgi:hypothetical protein
MELDVPVALLISPNAATAIQLIIVRKEQMDVLLLLRNDFRGDWNFELFPRTNLAC